MRQRMASGLGSITGDDISKGLCTTTMNWLVFPGCKAYTMDAWKTMQNVPAPPGPLAPPAVAGGLSTSPFPIALNDVSAQIDAALTAGKAATDANNLQFFNSVPDIPAPPDPVSIPWYVWLGLGMAGVVVAKEALA